MGDCNARGGGHHTGSEEDVGGVFRGQSADVEEGVDLVQVKPLLVNSKARRFLL